LAPPAFSRTSLTITCTYDYAKRLASAIIGGIPTISFRYDGLRDRLEQFVDILPTEYTLDLAGGLTQVRFYKEMKMSRWRKSN